MEFSADTSAQIPGSQQPLCSAHVEGKCVHSNMKHQSRNAAAEPEESSSILLMLHKSEAEHKAALRFPAASSRTGLIQLRPIRLQRVHISPQLACMHAVRAAAIFYHTIAVRYGSKAPCKRYLLQEYKVETLDTLGNIAKWPVGGALHQQAIKYKETAQISALSSHSSFI